MTDAHKNSKKVYIHTIGCQMNVYDSGQMMARVGALGYDTPADADQADLIIVNTCAIREKAVQKMASFLGRFADAKKKRPGTRLVVAGCVAQQQGRKILERFPYVDIVLGTHALAELPLLLARIEAGAGPQVAIEMNEAPEKTDAERMRRFHQSGVSDYVTIMRGCDNFCTYCVVPYVRGREVSRTPDDIVSEIRARVALGMKEVTLLGQNVNSYGLKEGLCSFVALLETVNRIDGLKRIRFVTSHPKDLSLELIQTFTRLDKLCHHIHLPVQSGSDRVLKRMNRRYTVADYLDKIRRLREAVPDIAVTTDIIVGFPSETASDFEQTLELIRQVEFDSLFAFAYSDRPDAPARRFPGKVPVDEKNRRLQELFAVQEHISRQKQAALVGRTLGVLVEGESKRQQKLDGPEHPNRCAELSGRSSGNRIVNFSCPAGCGLDIRNLKGQIIPVKIEKAFANSLWGVPAGVASASPLQSKGECVYVA